MSDFIFMLIAYGIFALPLLFGWLMIVRLQRMKKLDGSYPRNLRAREFAALILLLVLFLLTSWFNYYAIFLVGGARF